MLFGRAIISGLVQSVLTVIAMRAKSSDRRIEMPDGSVRQVGALVYRFKNSHPEILLITSRRSGRWILPKGWPQLGKSFAQSAKAEAYEEAGVRGDVLPIPIGTYTYEKLTDREGEDTDTVDRFVVEVFPIRFSHHEKDWPERGERQLEWLSIEESSRRVEEPELKALITSFDPRITTSPGRSKPT